MLDPLHFLFLNLLNCLKRSGTGHLPLALPLFFPIGRLFVEVTVKPETPVYVYAYINLYVFPWYMRVLGPLLGPICRNLELLYLLTVKLIH